MMEVELIAVGNELLLGETVDTNSAHAARRLAETGVRVARTTHVGDDPERLVALFREVRGRSRWAITMGGLGPTHDDVTREALAEALGRGLHEDGAVLAEVEVRFRRHGWEMPPSNRRQAMVPEGATVISNPNGTAPGLVLEDGGTTFFVLPGVPTEMAAMLETAVLPVLSAAAGENALVVKSHVVHTVGIGESALAERLEDVVREAGEIQVAFLPHLGQVDVRLTAMGLRAAEAEGKLRALVERVVERAQPWVYGTDGATLDRAIGDALAHRGWRVAVAESCTAGEVGMELTRTAGSSAWFVGGVLAYANDVKEAVLGVPAELLARHGAVSEEACRAMIDGVRARLGAEVGCATTGIAGPAGGSEEKPVGLVWYGVGTPEGTEVRRALFPGDRAAVRRRATIAVLALLLRVARGEEAA
jgi:nicotinamide-nucleotide amidase